MLSYIDILTLMLTLFVLLLVLQPKHETSVSGPIPELEGLLSLTSVEPGFVELMRDEELEVGGSVDLTEEAYQGPELAPSAESGVTRAEGAVESASYIENLRTLPSAAIGAFMQPRRSSESGFGKMNLDVPTWATAAFGKTIDIRNIDLSANHAEHPRSTGLEELREKLTKHDLAGRLKVSQISEDVHLEMSDQILFAEGSARLKSEGQRLLNALAQVLSDHRGVISVEGHTDDRPISSLQFPSNWELSSGRATTVTRHLIDRGLDPIKLRAVGYADTRPLDSNATSKGRMRNRRVSLILTPHRSDY
jgi:chemotaxis protein MotB